jgi:putative ABC transport system permease protein
MPDWGKHIESAVGDIQLDPARLAEVSEELAQDLDDRYHALLSEGVAQADAERIVISELHSGRLGADLRRVLDPPKLRLEPGSPDPAALLPSLWRDLRYGFRQLRLSPGFTIAALLSLALGIGANTAIFELLDAVRMRTLPVNDPQELAAIRKRGNRVGTGRGGYDLTTAIYEAIRARQQGFSAVSASAAFTVDLSRTGEVHNGRVMFAGGDLFSLLGVGSAAGRLIGPHDDQRGCSNPPAVVSYAYWQAEMGGRTNVIGERVWVQRHPFLIVGVTPRSFFGLDVGRRFDVALPLCAEPLVYGEGALYDNPIGFWIGMVGRLKPGWTMERASAQLRAMSPAIMQATMPRKYNAEQRQQYAKSVLSAEPAATGRSRLRDTYNQPFWLLLGLAGLVLLIACANLANLMLARAAAREREMAVRLALGASRARLLRQLFSESLLLAVLGALGGIALAQVLGRVLVPFLGSQNAHIFLDLHLDWRVIGFTAGLALVTSILFGLSPALQASRVAPAEVMKSGGRGIVASRSGFSFRRMLVAAQIALSLALVIGALLFVQTFRNLLTQDVGFDPNQILSANVDFSNLKIPMQERVAFWERLTQSVAALPGVQSVARAMAGPVNGGNWNEEINVPLAGTVKQLSWFDAISPGYFATIRNRLIAGRDFTDKDGHGAPAVAIISRTFATKLFHDPAPIGKTFGVVQYGDKPDVIYQVVGVTEDLKYENLRKGFDPVAYVPDRLNPAPFSQISLVIRSNQPADILMPETRRALLQVNPDLVLQFSRLKDDMADTLVAERLMAMLAGFFGVLAIILAVVGLYGVIAYMVARRTNEIGIRMALGANRGSILGLVMREVAGICAIGLGVGLGLTLAAGPAARSLLFQLRPTNPATLLAAILGVGIIAVLASLLPAWRAAKLDPLVALHEE